MVVLNSVVQYFPDVEYLLAVLERSIGLVGAGGRVFVGDVRHSGLLAAFHGSVQLFRARGGLSVGHVRGQIARAQGQEKELVIDPIFSWRLRSELRRSVMWRSCSSVVEVTTS
jgi:hypothetical protein